jgi:Ca2+-transporting ATPase
VACDVRAGPKVPNPPALGLTQDEAAARLAQGGRNELLAPRTLGILAILGRQLTDTVIVVLLLVAAALTTAVADWPDTAVMTALGRRLAVGVSLAAVAVAVLNLGSGRGTETTLVLAISLAVAAIPESLPAVVALSLALAARRMTGRGVLARRLAAVEALGSVTVIAADKTGTLTEGRMALAEVWTPTGTADDDAHGLLQAAGLCNDAYANGQPGERDDPTELALVDAAINLGIDV